MIMEKEQAAERLRRAIPYFRGAVNDAKSEGMVKMGILSKNPDGSGRILMEFDCEEFFNDIATVIDAPPQTMQDDMTFKAQSFLAKHGLTVERKD